MVRYYIYLFTEVGNKITCMEYNVRHFEVDNIMLHLFPIDYGEVIHIHLDPSMRFEVVPYRYWIEVHRGCDNERSE